jgi:hypothetical protein
VRPVSAAFLDAVTRSHRVAVKATVLQNGVAVQELDSIVSGTVTLDITAASRGRVDLTIVNPDLVPTSPTDLLTPYGNEIKVERGVRFPNGSVEYAALGVFRIDRAQVTDTPDGGVQIVVSGLDRSGRVIDARFEDTYQVAAGTGIPAAIEAVIAAAIPGLTFNLSATSATTGQVTANEGDDRWKFAQDLAAAAGQVLYFDGDGVLVSRPVAQTGATAPAVQLVEGEGGLLVSASRSWVREGTYNRVIATGENTGNGAPVRGVATDENASSPTYYFGAFGKVPRFYSSPFLTTNAQCSDAAQAVLSRELGTTQQVDFGTVPNPALEPNDVARVTRVRAGIDEDHVIDSLSIGLGADGVMSGRSRAVTV